MTLMEFIESNSMESLDPVNVRNIDASSWHPMDPVSPVAPVDSNNDFALLDADEARGPETAAIVDSISKDIQVDSELIDYGDVPDEPGLFIKRGSCELITQST